MSATITQSSAPSALSSPAHNSSAAQNTSGVSGEPSVLSMQTPSHAVVTSSTAAEAFLNQQAPSPAAPASSERAYLRNLTEARFVYRVEIIAVAVLLLFVVLGLVTMLMDQR